MPQSNPLKQIGIAYQHFWLDGVHCMGETILWICHCNITVTTVAKTRPVLAALVLAFDVLLQQSALSQFFDGMLVAINVRKKEVFRFPGEPIGAVGKPIVEVLFLGHERNRFLQKQTKRTQKCNKNKKKM